MSHVPVMLKEAVTALDLIAGKRIVDCTFGAGGYSREILKTPDVFLLGLDRDPAVQVEADRLIQSSSPHFSFYQTAFSDLEQVLQQHGWEGADGIVLDVGVSSMQIDQDVRGFSFMRDGPLDMRMSQSGVSAADVVNQLPERDLSWIFKILGEEKRNRRAAEAIGARREIEPITSTGQLAQLLEQALGPKKGRIHPATKVFQALRIYVNDELGELSRLLLAAERVLSPSGRLVVVAFHSLEDRLVKNFLRLRSEAPSLGSRHAPVEQRSVFQASFELQQRKVMLPSSSEVTENPRSRSARLRWASRTNAPAMSVVPVFAQMADITQLEARS